MAARGYSTQELMAAVIARNLADGEVAFMQGLSQVPMAACRLAQLTHAPNLTYVVGPTGAVNPLLEPLAPSTGDYGNLAAESMVSYSNLVLLQGRDLRFDVFFAGGLQIDPFGNCNLVCLGDWKAPRLRGPGSLGLTLMGRAGRGIIYTLGHNPQVFVERLDFLSGPAEWEGRDPSLVVTPLATFDFDPQSKRMRLVSVHPGSTVEGVKAGTGFDLIVPEHVPITQAPTAHEMELIRRVDLDGVLA